MKRVLIESIVLSVASMILMATVCVAAGGGTATSSGSTTGSGSGGTVSSSSGASNSASAASSAGGTSSSSSATSRASTSGASNSRAGGKNSSKNSNSSAVSLIANVLSTKSQPLGSAVYVQTKDSTGQVTASVLTVNISPLPSSMAGSTLNVVVDSVVVGTAKVTAGTAKQPPSAQLNLSSANKQNVPAVTPGSFFQVSPPKGAQLGQGTFMTSSAN